MSLYILLSLGSGESEAMALKQVYWSVFWLTVVLFLIIVLYPIAIPHPTKFQTEAISFVKDAVKVFVGFLVGGYTGERSRR